MEYHNYANDLKMNQVRLSQSFKCLEGRYSIEQEGSFGRGEFFWIKNQSTNQKYLLSNTYCTMVLIQLEVIAKRDRC